MLIGIPKEILSNETRVAATPEIVKKLIAANHTVNIEKKNRIPTMYCFII